MTPHKKSVFTIMLSVGLFLGVAACHGKPKTNAATQPSANQNDQGDPADANNAPANASAPADDNGAPNRRSRGSLEPVLLVAAGRTAAIQPE